MEHRAETRLSRMRARILTAAETLFPEKGFLGTSMDEVAAAAQVSKQTVYSHFRSKEALFIAVAEGMTGRAVSEHRSRVDAMTYERDVGDYLFHFAVEQLAVVMTTDLMRLRRLVIAEVERFPDLGRTLYRNGPGRAIDRLTEALDHYRASGRLTVIDLAQAATFFNWLVMGGPTTEAMLLGQASMCDRASYEAHARECVRIFLAAYGATEA